MYKKNLIHNGQKYDLSQMSYADLITLLNSLEQESSEIERALTQWKHEHGGATNAVWEISANVVMSKLLQVEGWARMKQPYHPNMGQ